jgi:hydrogenase maturation factor
VLLLAVSPERTDDLLAALQERATPATAVIGEIVAVDPEGHITIFNNTVHTQGEQSIEYEAKIAYHCK